MTKIENLLEILIPASDGHPSAAQAISSESLIADISRLHDYSLVEKMLDTLPVNLAEIGVDQAEAEVSKCESSFPKEFAILLNAVYIAYYESPEVLRRVNEKTGYNINPPQPAGYSLEEFDTSLLANVKNRKPFWKVDHGNA
jgi:hypothetical protein